MELKNLNKADIRCFNWLKVNEKDVNIPLIQGKPYRGKIANFNENKNYKLTFYKSILNFKFKKSLSNEFIDILRGNYNSGFTLEINENSQLNEVIFINYVLDKDNPELLEIGEILARKNSKSTVIINYSIKDAISPIHLGALKIKAEENSILNIIKIQNSENNLESVYIEEDENANVNFTSIDFAKDNNLVNYYCGLNGNKSTNTLNTVYLGHDNDNLDFNFQIDHIGENTKGTINTRGVLANNSKKTMKATINFVKGSKSSKGSESEYVMILSPDVLNNCVPILLCDEEDVSGEHAASIGRINEDTLFYLMTRGLSKEESRNLIVMGYLNPIIDLIPNEDIQRSLQMEIKKRAEIYD